ncbi:MAG: hypothetical protein P8J87_20040, partial [Verrucomicrobiales bacterium]|nr:hypothetical protein [Verrucomicrobiales bacterium]
PRAVTSGVTTIHIYFQLSPGEADENAMFRYQTRLQAPKADTTNDLSFMMNGEEFHFEEATGPDVPLEIDVTFRGGDTFNAAGPNVLSVQRTGGDLAGGSAWIQFDYHQLSLDLESIGCQVPICSYSADTTLVNPGESANLSWLIPNAATASIDNGVGDVAPLTTNGIGTSAVSPTQNTTYTLTSSSGGNNASQAITVEVLNIAAFTTDFPTIFSGEPVILSWDVDPSASVSITANNGDSPGNVDANTFNGIGDLEVNPTGTTTYTLTSTRGADVHTAELTVTQIGIEAFDSDDNEIFPEEPAPLLSWVTDPAATLTITADNGPSPGSVDAITTNGAGSIEVNPTAESTTYTLTANVGGTVFTSQVTIEVNGYQQLWQIGDDNNGNGELEQERNGMRDFYLNDGDYTQLFPAGLDWVDGPELLNNGINGDDIGMPRAFTTGFQDIDIYFQLAEEWTDPDTRFRLTLEVQSVRTLAQLPSSHDVSFLINDTLVHSVTDNTLETIRDTFTAAEVGMQAGSNVVSLRRDGGVIPQWPNGTSNPNASWIVFDFYRLEAIKAVEPAPVDLLITNLEIDDILGGVTVTWKSTIDKTYRIESSTDLKAWTSVQAGWP